MINDALNLTGYTESLMHAAFYMQPLSGYLRISGEDRHAFLQRQTTNDINRLLPDQVLETILTSPAARIIDVLALFDEADSIGGVTLPGLGQETKDYLRSRIFFLDKVSIEDASEEYTLIELLGPEIALFLIISDCLSSQRLMKFKDLTRVSFNFVSGNT
jgi:folate-binding Fe-S cluster repair protein YgfZ